MPKWVSNKGLIGYFLVLGIASILFYDHSLHPGWMLIGSVEVISFFYFGNMLSKNWSVSKISNERTFERNLFFVGLVCRFLAVLLVYWGFMEYYGDAFGFEDGDAKYYHILGTDLADAVRENRYFNTWMEVYNGSELSDMGYPTYLGVIYLLLGNDAILTPRLINCIISAYSVVLIFRLSCRNFGCSIGRVAGIFVMLWPNFWFYCGTQLKEPWMIFLLVSFAEKVDVMLREQRFSVLKIIYVLFLAGLMFTLRAPLAIVMILSLLFSIFMSSTRVIGWGKRIMIGFLVLCLIGVTMGNSINEQANDLLKQAQSNQQEQNMEWRTTRENGNAFAKYAGRTVFAPLIFTIPFPTLTETPLQYDLKVVNGGNFCKNIISGFVIFAMASLLLSGRWRNHMVPISLLVGYLVVLAVSTFAQSERFHQPVVPFEMMFAAYGIGLITHGDFVFGKYLPQGNTRTYKRWFTYWFLGIVFACVVWQWFKLAGRGMA